jgi:PhnB protein
MHHRLEREEVGVKITPYLAAKPASDAIAFYAKAFGAEERYRMQDDAGRIGHAELRIGDSVMYLSDEWAEHNVRSPATLGGNSVSFVLDVADVDAAWKRALDAGATVERPVAEAPYGRGGWLIDPFGHRWNVITPNPDFQPEDVR